MAILFSRRSGIHYLDHARVLADGKEVAYAQEKRGLTRFWAIPTENTVVLLLGPGTSLTQKAAERLAEDGVMVAFTAGGATPLFLASQSEYRPTGRLQSWISWWPDPARRLVVAKALQQERLAQIRRCWPGIGDGFTVPEALLSAHEEALAASPDITHVMAAEGRFAKQLYRESAAQRQIPWPGRDTQPRAQAGRKDPLNEALDRGNYLAYGIAAATLWALGLPPSLPVTHGATRAGGLVFDLADMFKDAVVLPVSVESACQRQGASQDHRNALTAAFHDLNIIPLCFAVMDRMTALGAAR